jgi:uncharacterized Tic20 family protein
MDNPKYENIEEEPWNERIEDYIWEKKKEAEKKSDEQKIEGDKNRVKFYLVSIPPILVSAILTVFSNFIPHEYNWSIQLLSTFVTIGNGLALFLNYGDRYATNYAFEKDYQTIISMIKLEMARKQKYRRVPDVFSNEIRLRMEFLNQQAPEINKIKFCSDSSINDDSLYRYYKKSDDIILDIV